ncbi:MAG: mannose-1-phosphate guanylyltransferase [Fusobacteriaceae bacterium]|nr:mannose-1-phosphate guanylyltransferase [Fusobacteriaceae bacterium]MBN2838760.1 mannose-1-phosphate guanylyltransferase [Fusobacteriaceae bacterium]
MLTALIMAGGSGQRFWPLSTEKKPKQLLKLFSSKSMIRETVDRILPLIPTERIFVATNIQQVEGIMEELPFLPKENIIIEPLMKDTAACIGYSALVVEKAFPNSEMVVLASDHLIQKEQIFRDILVKAASEVVKNEENIFTLGIKPDKPHTGYGYIEVNKKDFVEKLDIYNVKAFHEKPNYDRAEFFLEEGNFYWNSGMFIWKTHTIIENIKKYMPEHGLVINNLKLIIENEKLNEEEKSDRIKDEFEKFEKISIDYGVMEKSDKIQVIPVDIGWNDIGSYPSLEEVFEKNQNDSIIRNARVIEIDSEKNIVIGDKGRTIATLGVRDLIIVDSEEGLLICDKNSAQHIKKVIQEL